MSEWCVSGADMKKQIFPYVVIYGEKVADTTLGKNAVDG